MKLYKSRLEAVESSLMLDDAIVLENPDFVKTLTEDADLCVLFKELVAFRKHNRGETKYCSVHDLITKAAALNAFIIAIEDMTKESEWFKERVKY